MIKSALLVLMFLFISHAFAQVIMTYRNNAPLPGDTIITYSVEPFAVGNEGPDQVWDFTKIQLNGEKNVSLVSGKPALPIAGLTNFDFTFTEKGYEYFYKNDEITSTVVGLTIRDLSVIFTDPVLKMKYPVLYGTNFTDEFTGTGSDKLSTDIGLSGSYSLKADAFGTVLFHDRIIKDVLRLKISENKIQINQCGLYESVIATYLWYAPGARYPVLGLTTRQMSINGKEPVITTTAYMNPKMSRSGMLLAGTDNNTIENEEVALVLYPNPFVSTLNYNYFLRKQMPVTLELVDMTGKTILSLFNEEIQSEGFHSGELDAAKHNLKMGVYNFRFKFGEDEMVSKVVKM